MTPTKVLIGQILIVFGIVLAGVWYATEWTAAALGYQMRLGAPWFLFHHVPVYHSWRLFEWWYAYEPYAPGVFTTGGTIAAGSGVFAAAAAIMGSVWRARQSKLVTTYGSARWATARDLRRAGLARPAGVFPGAGRPPLPPSRRPIADLVDAEHPVSLYLVVPLADIVRTKPLIRLLLNQIGRRLTETLELEGGMPKRRRVLFMLDEFPALERLDFFESALSFMAGYGLRAFLVAQSLNQIEKAYGPNNSILDNCHVRVAFATNDERTAKRISDALGTTTELRAQRNYAGQRLSPGSDI